MVDFLYDWTRNLAYYMLILTMVIQILPNQVYQKYIRFFMGLILIVLLIMPIFKALGKNDAFWKFYNSIEMEQKRKEIEDAANYLEERSPEVFGEDESKK